MIVDTNHGEFDCCDITRKERRAFYKRVKEVFTSQDLSQLHELGDDQLPFFCDPVQIISTWCWDMITDYFTVTKFHIPLARDLDSLNPWLLDCFSIIENEINNIQIHEREKHGN
jgi:hypothetical protein